MCFVAVINDDKLEANSGEEDEDGLAVESGDEALDEYDEFNMVTDSSSHPIHILIPMYLLNFSYFEGGWRWRDLSAVAFM